MEATEMQPLLTIVIPVYNEQESIRTAIETIKRDVTVSFKVLVVYDTDEDTTIPVVRAMQKSMDDVLLVRNKYGRGALNAIKTGMETADTRYVIVTMADLSDPPAVINDMIHLAEELNADVVCGSRYMEGGRQIGGPLIKGLMSRTAGLTLCWFAGIPTHDATNSFKLYRKSFLNEVTIDSDGGFELGLELVVKAYLSGRVISEVPTSWQDRVEGESHFKVLAWLPNYLKWYFKAYLKFLGVKE